MCAAATTDQIIDRHSHVRESGEKTLFFGTARYGAWRAQGPDRRHKLKVGCITPPTLNCGCPSVLQLILQRTRIYKTRADASVPHEHRLFGNIATFAFEPQYVVWSDTDIPVVSLLQEGLENIRIAPPVGDETGILPDLIGRQLKGFRKASGIA